MKKTQIFMTGLVLVALLSTAGCNLVKQAETLPEKIQHPVVESTTIAEGVLQPVEYTNLSFQISGIVSEILVAEGDAVKEGDVLARLGDTAALEAQLAKAKADQIEAENGLTTLNEQDDLIAWQAWLDLIAARQNLTAAEQAWDKIDVQATHNDIEDAEEDVKDALRELEDARDDLKYHQERGDDDDALEPYEDAVDDTQRAYDEAIWKRDTLQNTLDQASATLELARTALLDAENHYEATREGADPDDLALAQALLEAANAAVEAAEETLLKATLAAPFDGVIAELNLTRNTLAAPGQVAITIADYTTWVVETTDITENEVVNLEVGDSATITPDALPEVVLHGEIESISQVARTSFGDVTYCVRIKITDEMPLDARLRWGMTLEISFD